MNKQPRSKATPKLVPLAVAVKLLDVRLVPDDFDFADPATPRMLAALARFRVEASPRRTPFLVASKTLSVLVARARDEANNPCAVWQVNALVGFGWPASRARALSFEDALAAMDREKELRGRPYRGKTAGGSS